MNYIREAETVLWHYNDLYKSLTNLDRQISKLVRRSGPSELNAISIEPTGVHGSRNDNTYNLLFELKTLTESREQTVKELSVVNELLDNISAEQNCELYGQVLRKWYIEKIPKDDIAHEIGYATKRSVYDIKNKAIKKFAVQLFGIEAMKAI